MIPAIVPMIPAILPMSPANLPMIPAKLANDPCDCYSSKVYRVTEDGVIVTVVRCNGGWGDHYSNIVTVLWRMD